MYRVPQSIAIVLALIFFLLDPAYIFQHIKPSQAAAVDTSSIEGAYDMFEELGKGAFARVCRGVNRETGKSYAIKIIEKKQYKLNGGCEVLTKSYLLHICHQACHVYRSLSRVCLQRSSFSEAFPILPFCSYKMCLTRTMHCTL
jgi:serine/threonine protein kinase